MTDKDIFEEKAPEVLADLARLVEAELIKSDKFNREHAKQIGIEVAQTIAKDWGGSVIYIPRNLVLLLSERDHRIFNEFNGSNHRELSRKYKVSMQWVYRIVKRITKEEIAKRQIDMFKQ